MKRRRAGQQQRGLAFAQLLDDPPNPLLIQSAGGEERNDIGGLKCSRDIPRQRIWIARKARIEQDAPHRSDELRLRAGAQGQPPVSRGGGNRKARLGVDELAAHVHAPLAELSKLPRVING